VQQPRENAGPKLEGRVHKNEPTFQGIPERGRFLFLELVTEMSEQLLGTGHFDVTGKFVPSGMRENPLGGKRVMPNKRYKPEQIVTMLRQIEVGIANGKTTPQACKEAEITIQTFYRWRKEYGGLKMDQAKRLKELEKENGKLKRLVADLSLDKQILKDIAEGNF
jgi:putative transposase